MLTSLLTLLLAAHAQDALSLSAMRLVPVGTEPTLTLTASSDGEVTVDGRCGVTAFRGKRRMTHGDQWTVGLGTLPEGTHACTATIGLRDDAGGYGTMTTPFEVRVLSPLDLAVRSEELSVADRTLTVRASRPLSAVTIDVYGPGGARVGGATTGVPGLAVAEVEWTQGPGTEAVKLVVTAKDADGFTRALELVPWHYLIPHEDVVFETASDVIRPDETPKLEAAWGHLQEVLDKYGSVVEVRLYVAGYTDTVGPADANQALSDRRARSIAAWFRARGFQGPIAYQGFGEGALAVPTGDGVDEAANRRAVYVLSASPPAASSDFPRGAWRAL